MHPAHIAQPFVIRWIAITALLLAAWPAVATAQGGTPAAAPSGAISELFGLMPAQVPGIDDPTRAIVTYADIAAQLDAVGVEAPASMEDAGFDRWADATRALALPGDARNF